MKAILVLLLALATSLTTHAETAPLLTDSAATVKLCAPRMAGCATKIVVNGTAYIVGYDETNNKDNAITNLLESLITACRAKSILESPTFTAEGYVVNETGHFPNPTVEYPVFKITYLAEVFLP
jgi:hypothetical protein